MSKETGRVLSTREACVYVKFSEDKNVECLIDTGFNGFLSLPKKLVETFNLEIIGSQTIIAVGNKKIVCELASVEITWLGMTQNVEVIVNDGDDFLIGTELLQSCILRINYKNNKLTIRSVKS
ncbi:MAG: clan AA aspartic protease [Pyrinomonadaceae bacterium]|nr:clan AA aspartic protease [Pyrinomonadaceae bacterium]